MVISYLDAGLEDEIKVHCGGVKNLGVSIGKRQKLFLHFDEVLE